MKLTNKFPEISSWIFAFVLLAMFSCSKDNESEEPQGIHEENFVALSLAKEIAEEIKFNPNTSSKTNKNSSLGFAKKKIEKIDEIKNDDDKTVFYVVNYTAGGYIILSADNRTQPIIGFSEENKFVIDKSEDASYPLGLTSWIANAKKQITSIQNSTKRQTEMEKVAWRQVKDMLVGQNKSVFAKEPATQCTEHIETITKGPYLKSVWNQEEGFNDALPNIFCNSSNGHALVGSVPLAMAQVMRFYEYPTNYNWLSMPLVKATPTTASFMLDIHNAIGSMYSGWPEYNCGATSVSSYDDMGKVLKSKFKYTSADSGNYNYQVVKSNLTEGRPVILSGVSNIGGHMWVCDGYHDTNYYYNDCSGFSTLYFHMNWGWKADKASNGYFAFNNFNLSETSNDNGTGYNKDVKMIYNIKP